MANIRLLGLRVQGSDLRHTLPTPDVRQNGLLLFWRDLQVEGEHYRLHLTPPRIANLTQLPEQIQPTGAIVGMDVLLSHTRYPVGALHELIASFENGPNLL